MLFFAQIAYGNLQERIDRLIPILCEVESNGNLKAIGDNGKAKGILQLWKTYIDDVNRVYKTDYTHDDAMYYHNSCEIVILYLTHWGKYYERKYKKPATYEVLAKIHNGGPTAYRAKGNKKRNLDKYYKKVTRLL